VTELWNRLRNAWGDLSLRERALVSAAVGALAAVLFYLAVVNPFVSAAGRAHARVDAAELQLETITRLDREYQEVAARMASVEKRIRENRSRQNVLTLLESLASKSSVKIDSMQERSSPGHELYRETKVEVTLKSVSLTQTVAFLHSIESAERQFSIKGMRIKTQRDKSDLLDVTFTVSSFEAI
jgi:type II secretory pathway component PulM